MITKIDSTKCRGCGICVDRCPLDTLRLDTDVNNIPPCQDSCPLGVDIRGVLYQLQLGDLAQANELIRGTLPLPAVTGRVCNHPCESHCARKEVDEEVSIHALERFMGDYWLSERAQPIPNEYIEKVAVIGAGPAGMSCAYFLKKWGYPVTVFESESEPGGRLRREFSENRIPRQIIEAQIEYLEDMGIQFKTQSPVYKDGTMDAFTKQGYGALCLATGQRDDLANTPILGEAAEGDFDIDSVTFETPVAGVFAAGAIVNGPASVVEDMASGRGAAVSIDLFFKGQDVKLHRVRRPNKVEIPPKEGIEKKARQAVPILDTPHSPNGFHGVEPIIEAELEAERCMTCGSRAYIAHPEDCMTCFQCELKCPYGAPYVHPFKEVLPRALQYPREGSDQ